MDIASPTGPHEDRPDERDPGSPPSEPWPSDLGGTETPVGPWAAPRPPVEPAYPPASEGHAGSLDIYRDTDGHLVKFDSIGRKYAVDAHGTRTTRLKPDECPPDFSPEDFRLATKLAKSSGRSRDDYLEDIRARRAASSFARSTAARAVLSTLRPQNAANPRRGGCHRRWARCTCGRGAGRRHHQPCRSPRGPASGTC